MTGVLTLLVLMSLIGCALLLAARRWPADEDTLVVQVNTLLPQTQCAQCGYPGCLPYARAVVAGAPIDLCPPGGSVTHAALVRLLPERGHGMAPGEPVAAVALIDEHACIGCFLCVQACPVDAIIGAPKTMHTVLTEACTGCGLCLPPCPVNCIELIAGAGT